MALPFFVAILLQGTKKIGNIKAICWIFRGLKFESDAEIGQKGTLYKDLNL